MAKRKRRASSATPSDPPVRRGLIGPKRTVPAGIPRPPYAATGDPGPSVSSPVRTSEEVSAMRRAGAAAAEILILAADHVAPGVTTDEIDALVHEATIARGGYPSPLGYRGFPKSVCTSVNEIICHGIPDSRPLADGDIVNVDVTIFLDGVHGDTSATVMVGDVDEDSERLVRATHASLYAAIDVVEPGVALSAIGKVIESHARRSGLSVVREFIGHGIGTEFHTSIQIPHYHEPRLRTPMEEGMTFTIEPMLNLGDRHLHVWDDDWTAATDDGCRSAQFEHTLLVTPDGVDILTVTSDGACAHDRYATALTETRG